MIAADEQATRFESSDSVVHPLRAGGSIPKARFESVRRSMMLDFCKWDAQVEDLCTLAPFPLLMSRAEWKHISGLAEALAWETEKAEDELLTRGELHHLLSIPRRVRQALHPDSGAHVTPCAVRVLRFDFHWAANGWCVSEVNSDVPGGFAEASEFPRLIAAHYPGFEPAGNPAATWLDAMRERCNIGAHVGLLSAAGFIEDQQVVAYLARKLTCGGIHPHILQLGQIYWREKNAFCTADGTDLPLAAIVRFYQAEWLESGPHSQWWQLLAGATTPVSNPGKALFSESKRFPLVWNALNTSMHAWRKLLPHTCDPREVAWKSDDRYLLKDAWCNTGDSVLSGRWTPAAEWKRAQLDAWLRPRRWIAQRRFDARPVPTPIGEMFPCVGVYTINGRTAGAYTRLSYGPVVNFQAVDVALLIETERKNEPIGKEGGH